MLDIIENIDGLTRLNECFLGLSECDGTNPCPVHFIVEPFKNRNNLALKLGADEVIDPTACNLKDEILNLDIKKNISKDDVKNAYIKIQKKIHPDISPETTRLSTIVNEAKEIVLKDFTETGKT